ncbi:MAG: right-handed parallel beta-helix repeat-containing protein [Sedimentisphaerales bacterium]|nr:right-handed parallel beta-helix repeat-containing protein [Sedimentisphaerales bacterium]
MMTARVCLAPLCSLLLWSLNPAPVYSRHYYVSPTGSDSNPGTRGRPWQSIEKVNVTDLGPGDCVQFRAGQRFAGTITLGRDDSGTPTRKLIVTCYGKGRAIIDGGNGSSLRAEGCDSLVVENLGFAGSGRKEGNTEDGVYVTGSQGLEINSIEVSGFRGSGVRLDGVRDARITNAYAHENGSAGISVGHDQPSSHLRIDYCVADNNPGDPSNVTNHSGNGIVVGNVSEAIIEYCEASNNGWDMPRKGNGPVGIWAWNADRVTIQFCISHDNKSPGDDGGGFDLDGGVTDSFLQYNLSYNNDGPGYFLCQYPGAPDFKNNVIRYNVSHNDGVKNNRRSGIDVFSAASNASDCQVYNNTVYNSNGSAVGFGGLPMPGVVFRNNVFICTGDVVAGETQRGRFENNVYWSADGKALSFDGRATLDEWAEATGQETIGGRIVGKCIDPRLRMTPATLPTDPTRLTRMAVCRLTADSPCVKAGMLIQDNGGRDFWGNRVPGDTRPAVGACEKP